MKRYFLLWMALVGLLALSAQTTHTMRYDQAWKKVVELEEKSLPQSAAAEVNSILNRAILEKNSPQVIKALIHQGKYNLVLDVQNDTLIFRNLNEMVKKSSDVVEQSVLHSMLGELYMQYYQKEHQAINQRTEVGDFVPADMKEWTRNIFYNKVTEQLNASIAHEGELIKAKVESYADVVELGRDSRRFYPSMYDFLTNRAVEIFSQISPDKDLSRTLKHKNISIQSLFAPAEEFVTLSFNPQASEQGLWTLETYRKLIASLLKRDMKQSVLLTELNKLDYLSRFHSVYTTRALPSLKRLQEKWEGQDISVEIIDKIAGLYQSHLWELSGSDSLKRAAAAKDLYDLLRSYISSFPGYERISALENRLRQLTQPQYTVSGEKTFPIKGKKRWKIQYKNLVSLNATLYRIDSPTEVGMVQSERWKRVDGKRTFLKNITVPLPQIAEYMQGETDFLLEVDHPGTYMLTFGSTPGGIENGLSDYYFSVSDLSVFARSSAKERYDFFVVNRVTGEPVRKAKINIYMQSGNWRNSKLTVVESVVTNDEGLAVYHKGEINSDLFYQAVSGKDNGSQLYRLPYEYYEYAENADAGRDQVSIFTDRSLYRPGQTLFYKAVFTRAKGGENSIVKNKTANFVLRDVNRREISKQTLITNEYGSVSGEFVLPQGTLPGNFSIETDEGGTDFRVEEYKRPSFEVTFDTIGKTYKFGDEITLRGKAENFSGIRLQDAEVEWRIARQQTWWWRWGDVPEHFTEGTVTTDKNGAFEISFTPLKPDEQYSLRSVFSFVVEAAVTDLNGETQTGTYSIPVGDVSMILQAEIPDRMEKKSGQHIVISAKNLDGADIDAVGTYRLYLLQRNDSIDQLVAEGPFECGEQPEMKKQLAGMRSGKYRLKLQSEDDRGNPVEAEKDFILYSFADKRPPIKTNEWLVEKSAFFSEGKSGEVILGVSDKVNVLYELWQRDRLLERKWLKLNNENRLFDIPYKRSYEEGVTLMLTYVKEERFYAHSVELRPVKEEKKLNVKLDVFRDKVRPGDNEEWRITVTDAGGNPSRAEVLASMYDFSLDRIYPSHPWSLSLHMPGPYYSRMGLVSDQSFNPQTAMGYFSIPTVDVLPFSFDRFNWFNFSFYSGRLMLRGSAVDAKNAAASGFLAEEELLSGRRVSDNSDMAKREEAAAGLSVQSQIPQIRRNFHETAFFYPHLRTNEKGETQIAFVVPESNTRWRFRVLAHDQQLNTGKAEAIIVSQKELMVTPHMPRFLRHGDRTSVSTKISNLSGTTQSGKVTLELFNPVTDELLLNIPVPNSEKEFTLFPDASADASWTFDVPFGIDLLGVRIVAETPQFSDGEQHALAVLPNRMLVTESMRLDVNGNRTKTFSMGRLLNKRSASIRDYRLTLEFASNPVWYAVQALPVLGEPVSDNAVSWFASYYANMLGTHIGKVYPRVLNMVEAWRKQGGSKETFYSDLEKNQELKNVLLEETPWVLEANTESEQKEKLSFLFDLNRSRNLTQTALGKLQELQTSQGGWSWFKGFKPNVGITHYILSGFFQLQELGAVEFSGETASMQSSAISFIDAEAIRRFEELKKLNKDWKNIKSISGIDLEYLFVRTAYVNHPLGATEREMIRFYRAVIEKNWTSFGPYERSLIAIVLQREGETKVVQQMLNSFREHAAISDEMGMYWPNNRAQVFMSQSAISVHTFIMEAFRVGGAKEGEMDKMKQWLLKQKQTQMWESTHATIDAIYALLSQGSDWFSSEGETRVTLGNRLVEAEKSELGTGYLKDSWSHAEIAPEMGRVTVTHKGEGPAWGALYWQYYEDLDKIIQYGASLDIGKQLFVEQTDSTGISLIRIVEDTPLTVGDKVVARLVVRTDRDLEFVHLKDMYAAAFEPVSQISGTGWQNGILYYRTSKDASTNFYFDVLPRGTYVFEYAMIVGRSGAYSNGITTLQCLYAPEFNSHSAGIRIIVKQ